jgi:hypothetical protein
MPLLVESQADVHMPKKISPELRAWAIQMVAEREEDYPSVPAASQAPWHSSWDLAGRRSAAGWSGGRDRLRRPGGDDSSRLDATPPYRRLDVMLSRDHFE